MAQSFNNFDMAALRRVAGGSKLQKSGRQDHSCKAAMPAIQNEVSKCS
jgi:hypothetical protein